MNLFKMNKRTRMGNYRGYHRRMFIACTLDGEYMIAASDMEQAKKEVLRHGLECDRIKATDEMVSIFKSGQVYENF